MDMSGRLPEVNHARGTPLPPATRLTDYLRLALGSSPIHVNFGNARRARLVVALAQLGHLDHIKCSASEVVPPIEMMTIRTAKTSAIKIGVISEGIVPAATSPIFARE
jgi:hypothetical protein